MNYGRRTVAFFELHQPFCSLTYGASPCQAVLGGTGPRKCYNTFATCQDQDNFTAGTLTLRCGRHEDRLPLQYGPLIPCLEEIVTTPGRLNIGGMEDTSAAFGKREVVTVRLRDMRHSDAQLDKYRLERTFVQGPRFAGVRIPASSFPTFGPRARGIPELELAVREFFGHDDIALAPWNRGSLWSRWLARNPHYPVMTCTVREGYEGDALEDMRERHYVVDRVEGPTDDGLVTFIVKDVFSKVEARKALVPHPSIGALAADITGSPGTFTVESGTGSLSPELGGYSTITATTQGWVAIGAKECVKATRVGDVFTVVQRAALGTPQSDHKAGDAVQLVKAIEAQLSHDIAYDFITGYTKIEASRINKPEWDGLAAEVDALFTAYIAEPTPVSELLGELEVQAGFTLWPDVSTGMIRYAALRAGATSPTVDDRGWVVDGSMDVRRRDDKRISQVIVYFVKRSALSRVKESQSYAARVVTPGPGASPYGAESVREIHSRWITTGGRGTAEQCGERVYAMYQDTPIEARFAIDATRDGQLAEARYFTLETAKIQDDVGDVKPVVMVPVSIKRGEEEHEIDAMTVRFSEDAEDGVRRIPVETDELDLNLRTLHDSQFATPIGDEVIEFIIDAPATIGSASTGGWAIRTGSWPTMATKPKLIIKGLVQGKGAAGVQGGGANGLDGANGLRGGDALLVEVPIELDDSAGRLWAGAGSGGAGGGSLNTFNFTQYGAGAGSGAGAGTTASPGGPRGVNSPPWPSNPAPQASDAGDGTASTSTAPGLGGAGQVTHFGGGVYGQGTGKGGDGGGPGLPGQNGEQAPPTGFTIQGNGGLAGPAGNYITGVALVTFVGSPGDRRGNVA